MHRKYLNFERHSLARRGCGAPNDAVRLAWEFVGMRQHYEFLNQYRAGYTLVILLESSVSSMLVCKNNKKTWAKNNYLNYFTTSVRY
jgi:hypothetical protein